MVTLEELKHRFDYNPDTGLFIYKISIMFIREGDVAGTPNTNGHIQIMINEQFYLAHNLAWFYMTGEWPSGFIVDHKDRKYDNNKWLNLRKATLSQNMGNTKLYSNNSTGLKGVHWDKRKNRFIAQITIHNKRTYLGSSTDKEEAYEIYLKAAIAHFGEFFNEH